MKTAPSFSTAALAELTPTGKLRASINLGNPILARKDEITGAAVGVSVDLAQALADLLGVALELIVVDTAKHSVENIGNDVVDIGFVAIDPKRAERVIFTPPYVLIEGAYLVKDGSPLKSLAEVDQSGLTVVVGRGSAYDLHLSRELKNANIVRAETSPTVVDTFISGAYDVAAGVRQQLEFDAKRINGLRLLPGNFMQIEQAMATPRSRGECIASLIQDYIEWQKSIGFIDRALSRHKIQGATVAPVR